MSVSMLRVKPVGAPSATMNRFRLGAKSYGLAACVCLYRHEVGKAGPAEFLVLTPDMRFAHVARPALMPGEELDMRAYAAIELSADEARDFLTAHGEGDMVDDFPDLFAIVTRASRLIASGTVRENRHNTHDTAH